MAEVLPLNSTQSPLSEARIPDEEFAKMRAENMARWPTGADVDFDAAVRGCFAKLQW